MSIISKTAIASIMALSLASAVPARAASSAADFYKGKIITLLVPFGAGGGFGLYSRILADNMGRHIPGHPFIKPQFMPGAGGLKAANYLFNVAPHDGSVFAILSQTAALSQRLERGEKGSKIKYDLAEMNWLGRLVTMEAGVVGRIKSGVTSIRMLKNASKGKIVACASGKTDQAYINSKSIAEALGFPIQIIVGYPGAKDMMLAIERGECNFMTMSLSAFQTRGKYLLDEKIVKPLAVVNVDRSAFWPRIPTTVEIAPNARSKEVLEFIAHYAAIGRAYGLPPGPKRNIIDAMRTAFAETCKDPKFVEIFKQRKIPFNPASASVVEKNVNATLAASDALVARTRKMLGWDKSGS